MSPAALLVVALAHTAAAAAQDGSSAAAAEQVASLQPELVDRFNRRDIDGALEVLQRMSALQPSNMLHQLNIGGVAGDEPDERLQAYPQRAGAG